MLSLVLLVIAIPFLLYVPFIQDFARKIAVEKVSESTGMKIDIDYLRLHFPLNLDVDGLMVADSSGDTMITAASANVDVALMPLFRKQINVKSVELNDAFYRLGTADSSMYLTAKINEFHAGTTDIPLSFSRIKLDDAVLDGADINLVLKDTVIAEKPDTAKSRPMVIDVGSIELHNVRYRMSMLPVIDSLATVIPFARLNRGHVDTGKRTISVNELSVDSISATYLTPAIAEATEPPKTNADSISASSSEAWTITAQKITLTARDALYAARDAKPMAGFDPNYIQASAVTIEVDSFYNRATSIRVPIRNFSAAERCGITLHASGVFEMDSALMKAKNFNIATLNSNLYLDALMGIGNLIADPSLPLALKANGTLSLLDARLFMPSLASYISSLPTSAGLQIIADVHGTPASMDVEKLNLRLPGYLTFEANGRIDNPFDFNRMQGKVTFNGSLNNIDRLKKAFLPVATASQIRIPTSTIKGNVTYQPGNINGSIKLHTSKGQLALDGKWNQKAEGYDATLNVVRFPVSAFMPSLGIGEITADATVRGHGYDPSKRSTSAKANVDLHSVVYNGSPLTNISLTAAIDTCYLTADIVSDNHYADLMANADVTFKNGFYHWNLTSSIRQIDLQAMKVSKTPFHGSVDLSTTGAFNPRTSNIDTEITINDLDLTMDSMLIKIDALNGNLLSTDSLTRANIRSGDFDAELTAFTSVMSAVKSVTKASELAMRQVDSRKIDIDSLQQALPHMALYVDMGPMSPITELLTQHSGMKFSHAYLQFTNDSLITMQANVSDFVSGSTRLDNINFDANQHGKYLVYTAQVNNRPGTMDDFAHVSLNGFIADDKISAMLRQSNIDNKQGFFIGFNASVADSTVTVKLVPYSPVIAYKKWSINKDNVLAYNFMTRHIDANVKLMSDSSSVHLFTEHVETTDSLTNSPHQEDIIVKLDNIRLQDWLSISPFAPPVKGDIDADMRFRWDSKEITGKGNVAVNDLFYGNERVGTFGLNINVANENRTKALHADVDLLIDGQKVITATGALNDSTSVHPFMLDFSMIHFPLRVVNPFLPKNVAQLSGMLNGQMDITGSMTAPVFNGFLDFDSTAVAVAMTGASYRFSENKIPVDSNVVHFNDYIISGLNKNGLHVNGIVDARHISDIKFNLGLKASDMQVVNSTRARKGANVYGRAFIDVDATAKGNLNFMTVNADLNVLPGTNVTYVMTDAQQTLSPQSSSSDMVKFVNFADSANVAAADSLTNTGMAMILDANLTVSDGSTINVDLSPDGKNKASIQGAGTLSYLLTPLNGDGRVTGRFTINSGFVRYTPAIETGGVSMTIISEKNFKFQEGSYIAFNGDMLNPTLDIRATDRLKANVTQSGQNSRIVNFDVEVAVTNTLQNLNVAFNLSTDDDITIQNELASMSPEQRANQAMNMLLYNQYTGPGTKANSNLSGNPLYAFLASQLNTWAANNIKGVDISFGIDQYDTTTDGSRSTTTSYSYRVSKTLFNDRFKIVVGGNYSTDANADENFSQNLINDIAFEYMLNRSGTMYVRLFRHIGFESILEGEITQTGVGFVMKRKLNSLRDLFHFPFPKRAAIKPESLESVTDSTVKDNETDSIH